MSGGRERHDALDKRRNERFYVVTFNRFGDNSDRSDRLAEVSAEGTIVVVVGWRGTVPRVARRLGREWTVSVMVRTAAFVNVRVASVSANRCVAAVRMPYSANDAVNRL